MEKIIIDGASELEGSLKIQGAKNSSLPLLAATLLCKGKSVLHNCPKLSDVTAACEILTYLGCDVVTEENSIEIDANSLSQSDVPEKLMHEMRSSIVFLGAIIARMGKTRVSFPGGCELGPRPIDLHLSALRQLGVEIEESHGYLECSVPKSLNGAQISLTFPSVGATENIMLAAVTAKGKTTIINAAREPEIVDLANFLNKCGAKISGAGQSVVVIEGVDVLEGCEYSVMPDRIVAVTYLCCGAITRGDITVTEVNPYDIASVIPVFEQTGCEVSVKKDSIRVISKKPLKPVKMIKTMPFPGFPTDAQALIMALTTLSKGTSIFVENIFDCRYKHVSELVRMGAKIDVMGKIAVVEGVKALSGASVTSPDLRGGAALVVAGLAANGVTTIDGIHHIDRGYEQIEKNLTLLGAKIFREE